ncbi:winged helix-turn-helix transcriptional regulator [Paenibacillus allorhizosphaerae]|nr:winged helix-turn-helix transcriptional regulator [Paenibacillus allorhizosphaerae]
MEIPGRYSFFGILCIFAKKTYGEFVGSEEGIARNILADHLAKLTQHGILIKKAHPSDKRKDIYDLSEMGLDMIPILLEMAEWGAKYSDSAEQLPMEWLEVVRTRREEVIQIIRETVLQGGSIFAGENCVAARLLKDP